MKFSFQPRFNYADKRKDLILPRKSSTKLAEFIGVLTGDGYIGAYPEKYDYRVEIVGHKTLDYKYLTNHVSSLIKSLFNINPNIILRNDQKVICLRVCSKTLVKFIESTGFPTGKKRQIGIPKWIYENKNYMLAFIKGLFDTDGSLALKKGRAKKREYEPCIKLTSSSKQLRDLTYNFLIKQGFSLSKYTEFKELGITYSLQIFKQDNISKWVNLIGFNNEKHLSKYRKISGNAGI